LKKNKPTGIPSQGKKKQPMTVWDEMRLQVPKKTLHNEELNDLYFSPNIVRVTKSRRMRWAGHVVRMGEVRGVYRVLVGKPEGRNHWGDLGVDGWIIGWNSRRWDVGIWTGLGWPRIETGGGRL